MEIQVVDEALMCSQSRAAIRPRLHGYVGAASDVAEALADLNRGCRMVAVGELPRGLPERVTQVDGAPMVACDRCLACVRAWLRDLKDLVATGPSGRTRSPG